MRRVCLFALLALFIGLTGTMAQQPLHVVMLGDSNTWIGGDDCDKPKGWNKWFKDNFQPESCKSYARSGATWTNTSLTRRNTEENIGVLGNNNVIYNQICRLTAAVTRGTQTQPDVILIMAGTNDAWFTKARPKVFALSAEEAFITDDLLQRSVWQVTSLAESVRYGCTILQRTFPKARLVLLTPMPSTAAGATNIKKVSDIIADCGQRMGLSVIRLDRMSVETTDGTHTSEAGAQTVGAAVVRQLKDIIDQ